MSMVNFFHDKCENGEGKEKRKEKGKRVLEPRLGCVAVTR